MAMNRSRHTHGCNALDLDTRDMPPLRPLNGDLSPVQYI